MSNKVACFIPIKTNSERVKGKNFRLLNGKPLYSYIINSALESASFDSIFVDTDSDEIKEYCTALKINTIDRQPLLAENTASGNDLLNYHYSLYSEYDYYFQLFATAPLLRPETIASCVNSLMSATEKDSIFTAFKECGWFWFENSPVNYNPESLPRSQDAKMPFKETTGLYGITNESLKKNRCRIGKNPLFFFINEVESLDIDTEFDFKLAEIIARENKC